MRWGRFLSTSGLKAEGVSTASAAYTAAGRDDFLNDSKTHEAVLRSLQTLAESTTRLSQDVKSAHPEIEWSKIAGLRNVLVHEYLGVDLELIWEVVAQD